MASTAPGSESSESSTSSHETIAGGNSIGQAEMEQRPQAGPLPVKVPRLVGEIGYSEDDARLQNERPDNEANSVEGLSAAEADARNGRHPADRSQVNLTSPSALSLPNASSSTGDTLRNLNNSTTSLSTTNTSSKHSKFSILSLSSRFSAQKIAGVTLISLMRFCLLLLILCGVIVAWIVITSSLVKTPPPSPNVPQTSGSSAVFIHVAFTIMTLLTLIFIERSIFQLRAERYAHVHPGETLPSHRYPSSQASNGRSNGMGFAPWNRPPLPTYAAALGVRGTGDVEDAIIAAPPPPAYGNTRGSTLILASFWRNSRANNRRASAQPRMSARVSGVSTRSAPVSYDEAEHHSDIERARILEEALAKLEDDTGRS